MDRREEKWSEGLRKQFGYDRYDDGEFLSFLEESKRNALEFEASVRPSGTHWPENFVNAIHGLDRAELKESVGGESVETVLSDLLQTLTPRESKITELFYKEEKGIVEIAMECNVSIELIRSVLAKALRKLCRPSRAERLAACIETSDKEPAIRTVGREFDTGESGGADPEADGFFKHLFDDPENGDDTGGE